MAPYNYEDDDEYDPQAEYYAHEEERRRREHDMEYLHSPAGQYHIRYNDARNEDIARRNDELNKRYAEIMGNLSKFYFSRKGIIILIISFVLSLVTFPMNSLFQGLVTWNILILIVMGLFFYVTAKTKITTTVRPEITRDEAIRQSAREKAYRR